MSYRRSPNQWFKVWAEIIKKEKIISRVDLADISGCSLWTLKALSRDFIEQENYINYKNGKYEWWTPRIENTLSTLSQQDREDLK